MDRPVEIFFVLSELTLYACLQGSQPDKSHQTRALSIPQARFQRGHCHASHTCFFNRVSDMEKILTPGLLGRKRQVHFQFEEVSLWSLSAWSSCEGEN